MFDVERAVKRYKEGANSTAQRRYEESINALTENPMEKAAAAEDLYLRRVQEASQSGKRRAKLLAVPLSEYKAKAIAKSSRLISGMQQAEAAYRKAAQEWGPTYEAAHNIVQGMPKGTAEDAANRCAAVIRLMMQKAGRA
jgi:hypothetical protein